MPSLFTASAFENSEAPELPAVHPGEHLLEDFLKPLGLSMTQVAGDLGVPYRRIQEIAAGKRAVTAETAVLLAKYFDMSPQFWLGLQTTYDLDCLRGRMGEKLGRVRVLPRPDLAKARAESAPRERQSVSVERVASSTTPSPRRKTSD
jgi:addiction module HigA family antidote